ncbi:MAG: aldo/keto reductase [Acidobacteriota bacterium]|jgi:aryl-alcohol dehydrogenase-like predicted oxidoreductase|nr:aldo/keto reductase [Acidobacteriota bacterium]
MNSNFATPNGTENFKKRFSDFAEGHFREVEDLWLSSIGIGTYLGNWDEATDENYKNAVVKYVQSGGNVIDTASNYRFQRSERNIGEALKELDNGREELFIATKGGYLPFEMQPPSDVQSYFEENFVEKGIATFDDLVGGSHCMTPDYLQSQIDQSLENMGIDGVDLFYIHNPESQLSGGVDKPTFEAKIALAFERLEENRANSKINFYGVATWNGFRVQPNETGYHSLERFVQIAQEIGGDGHGFKFIQLPHNLAMPEAYLVPNQSANGKAVTTLQAAKDLGVSVMVSGSILQGKLSSGVPLHLRETLGGKTDAQTSLQFVRSTPNVTTTLVGMSSTSHVEENMALAKIEPTAEDKFAGLFTKDA